jgi:hypothetical protein
VKQCFPPRAARCLGAPSTIDDRQLGARRGNIPELAFGDTPGVGFIVTTGEEVANATLYVKTDLVVDIAFDARQSQHAAE